MPARKCLEQWRLGCEDLRARRGKDPDDVKIVSIIEAKIGFSGRRGCSVHPHAERRARKWFELRSRTFQFVRADLPVMIHIDRHKRFDVGAGEDHLRFEAIGEDLHRGRAQAGIVSTREAGDDKIVASQNARSAHQLMR